ncbi:class I SAM-dependent methyltransferase [Flavobacteriaceae bacterium S0862]|nr:class I SAM-dependent methyltransferase [Flavobacteriaceae bacterium S0862]
MTLIRNIYYKLPVSLRYVVRRLVYFPSDLFSKRDELVPPKGMIYTGTGDYLKVGDIFFKHFQTYGNITPESTILDIGSGIGRMSIPFTKFLNSKGSYRGFDVVKKGVNWCTKHITSKFPNFQFTYIPLKNDLYNLSTTDKASNYKFPYKDNEFDFVFLTSVFTHMLPDDVDNYLNEIGRVLKSKKRCLATFFILDDVSRALMVNSDKHFKYLRKNYALMSERVKEANVAYDKEYLFKLIQDKGFRIEKYLEGSWSGKADNVLSYQDILILKNT